PQDGIPHTEPSLVGSDMFIRDRFSLYQDTKDFAVLANVNNVFYKDYYDYVGSYAVYAAPLNVSVSASYDF
ncbi:hypothetical protein, partial [Enterobacter hormaechei]